MPCPVNVIKTTAEKTVLLEHLNHHIAQVDVTYLLQKKDVTGSGRYRHEHLTLESAHCTGGCAVTFSEEWQGRKWAMHTNCFNDEEGTEEGKVQ
eukprot:Em0024g108a